jgi:RND family efflux transporter MFP subunit
MKKLGLLILVIALAAGGRGIPLLAGPPPAAEEAEEMRATAERRDIESNLLLTGEVVPAFQFEVKSEVGGKVKQIHSAVGQFVPKGGLLVTIDDTDLLTEKRAAETEIEGAQLAVDKNRGNFQRANSLFEQKLISKEVFANLEADLAISENTLEKAKSRLQLVMDRLSKTKISAPADGTVLDISVTQGQVVVAAASVNAGTVLMTFADLSELLINSHVNQVDAPRLTKGQGVEVSMSDSAEEPVKARIEFIAPLALVKNNIKGFEVQAVIEDNDGRLKPGMSVSMNVPVGRAEKAISVPVSAVFKDRRQNVVYVRKGNSTEKRKVTVGVTNLSYAEITSGLEPGEEILLVEPQGEPAKS